VQANFNQLLDKPVNSKRQEGVLYICGQELDDPVSGLSFKFLTVPGTSAPFRIYVKSRGARTWRELCFSESGQFAGATTKPNSNPRVPGRLRVIK